jgi:hypothetical protein
VAKKATDLPEFLRQFLTGFAGLNLVSHRIKGTLCFFKRKRKQDSPLHFGLLLTLHA